MRLQDTSFSPSASAWSMAAWTRSWTIYSCGRAFAARVSVAQPWRPCSDFAVTTVSFSPCDSRGIHALLTSEDAEPERGFAEPPLPSVLLAHQLLVELAHARLLERLQH